MVNRILIGLIAAAGLGVVAILGLWLLARRPAIAEITPPPASAFAPDLVARGEVLAGGGYCASCHTAKGGQPYAGGYPLRTGFGTIYSTNITPDPKTGIGAWSEAAFRRAMHEGVARDGSHLFPAFPYDHFTKLSDADVSALYAYFMTRQPARAPARANDLPFPLNVRALQAGWKLLFFRPGRFVADAAKGADWNRGAYLAQGLSHCGACHTPRNVLGAEAHGRSFAGASIDNWIAPPLTRANPSPMPWSQDELLAFLRNGVSRYHGVAAGPMSQVVHDGLAKLPDSDVQALALYFADVDQAAARAGEAPAALQSALVANRLGTGLQYDPAVRLYTAACASCHYNGANGVKPLRPNLALNSAVSLDDPTNLIRVMLWGLDVKEGATGVVMPGFSGLSDADIATIARYLRATRTHRPAWRNLEHKVAQIRTQGRGSE